MEMAVHPNQSGTEGVMEMAVHPNQSGTESLNFLRFFFFFLLGIKLLHTRIGLISLFLTEKYEAELKSILREHDLEAHYGLDVK